MLVALLACSSPTAPAPAAPSGPPPALVQVAATLPQNYIAFEYPVARQEWWYEIIEGLPDPIVVDSFIDVWDKPGLGVTFNVAKAKQYLEAGDEDFFE